MMLKSSVMWSKFNNKLSWRIAIALIFVSPLSIMMSGYVLYQASFNKELQSTQKTVQEFVRAVSETAAISAYLNDAILGKEVVEGLFNSELISAAELSSTDYKIYAAGELDPALTTNQYYYSLYSPFNKSELVGHLIVQADTSVLQRYAKETASQYVAHIMGTSILAILVVVLVVNQLLVKPIKKVSSSLHNIQPGTEQRITMFDYPQKDEIQILATDINHLLDSVQKQLQNERDLRAEIEILESRFRKIFEQTSGGIALVNEKGVIQMHNPAFEHLVGMSIMDKIHDESNSSIYSLAPFNEQEAYEIRQSLKNFIPVSVDVKLNRHEGDIWLNFFISHLPSEDNREELYELVLTDISTHRKREDVLKNQAERDTLTGLYNRRAAERKISYLLDSSDDSPSQYALLMIDLDGFKPVNDDYGHDAGDKVLVELSSTLRKAVRMDDIVARWGGDEFVIFIKLNGHDIEVSGIANKLLNAIKTPVRVDDARIASVGASIGIALYPNNATNLHELLKQADKAMYQIKNGSKNGFKIAGIDKKRG